MKKQTRIFAVLLLLMTVLWAIPTASAQEAFFFDEYSRVIDQAELLTDSERTTLEERLDEIRYRQCVDIAVMTTDTLDGFTVSDYADMAFWQCGYGYGESRDGVMLLVNMGERDWHIYTSGNAIDYFSDEMLDSIGEQVLSYLAEGEYLQAFDLFAVLCDEEITWLLDYTNDYDYDREYDDQVYDDAFADEYLTEEFHAFSSDRLIVAILGGAIVALIVVLCMKAKLKSVRYRSSASDYVRAGSMQVTESRDLFLYHTVSRRPRPQNSSGGSAPSARGGSTHVASSGRRVGGRGGKF